MNRVSGVRQPMRAAAGCLVLLGVVGLAGCSSSTDSAPTSSASPVDTGQPGYCAQGDAVTASVDALVNTNILKEGTDTLKSRFDTVSTQTKALEESAKAQFAAQSEALAAAVATLQATLKDFADSPTIAEAGAIKPLLTAVNTATTDLVTAVNTACQ